MNPQVQVPSQPDPALPTGDQIQELLRANNELKQANARLSDAQDKLMQSEKLASIGQLAAGVAHEINNPIGFIFSNFGTLEKYLADLFLMLAAYEEAEAGLAGTEVGGKLKALREEVELDYLKEDIPTLMAESKDGITRVRNIVQNLKDFSRVDSSQEWVMADLHHGLDSTLNIVNNEIKYKADVVKSYGELPDVECLPSELNQVFMNLLVNAAHAIHAERGTITIRTGTVDAAAVWVEVQDNGSGIAKENLGRIFDPFFTTKPVGKGTGLGLSLSYGIVKKHLGQIEVFSEIGSGTTFRVTLPVRHPAEE
ncbi:MAG TPA: ATP-binding protein [Burkholderiaceae bacterium]|nr:ATP-binding protein [Burkholderiaceae bacterium]